MLENTALLYVNQSEFDARLTSYGITVLGAAIAALFHKGQTELCRAPYFAYSSMLFFFMAIAQLVWLSSIPAIIGGFLWIFMLVDVVVGLIVGYAYWVIAMARSRDAYGHGRMAFLALIPFGNLWLVLTRSKHAISASRVPTIPHLTGGVGIVTGVVLFFAGSTLLSVVQDKMNATVEVAAYDSKTQEAIIGELLGSEEGLRMTLQLIATEVTSQRIDEITKLQRIESDGTTLRYVYEVSSNAALLSESMKSSLLRKNCTLQALRSLIEAGATIEHVYRRSSGSEIGRVQVTQELCS